MLAKKLKKELQSFRRPIRCVISSADGVTFELNDGEMELVFNPAPGAAGVEPKVLLAPLRMLFVDADGQELMVQLDSKSPSTIAVGDKR